MGISSVVGGHIGSMVMRSKLRNNDGGRGGNGALEDLMLHAGSAAGRVLASQEGTRLVRDFHSRSAGLMTDKHRRKESLEGRSSVPHKPKSVWEDLTDTMNKTISNIEFMGIGEDGERSANQDDSLSTASSDYVSQAKDSAKNENSRRRKKLTSSLKKKKKTKDDEPPSRRNTNIISNSKNSSSKGKWSSALKKIKKVNMDNERAIENDALVTSTTKKSSVRRKWSDGLKKEKIAGSERSKVKNKNVKSISKKSAARRK